jgi:photosystem II stability/assembly factor-like uncharacterized protein
MSQLLIGTENGIFRLEPNGEGARRDGGPGTVAYLAAAGNAVYALTRDGALWARMGGADWRLVNERPVPDEAWSMAADPRLPGRLYLGVSPALLYRSDDGGASWTACDSVKRIPGYERWTFPPPPHIPHVRSIAPDPRVPGAVYIGVEEGGVYRSADGGETWESLNEGLYWDVHTVTPAPDGARLHATTGVGYHRSDDGGRHWRHITAGLDRGYTVPLVIAPEQPDRLFTAAAASPPPGWRAGANAALYRSDDGGEHWTRLERGLPSRFDTMVRELAVDEAGRVYAAAGHALYVSADAGETWRQIAADLPAIRALAVV